MLEGKKAKDTPIANGKTMGLQINAPHFFESADFMAWLNDPATVVWSWHNKGDAANDFSDICVGVDPSLGGEGTDSDMPEWAWQQIMDVVKQHYARDQSDFHILVRITNLQS